MAAVKNLVAFGWAFEPIACDQLIDRCLAAQLQGWMDLSLSGVKG